MAPALPPLSGFTPDDAKGFTHYFFTQATFLCAPEVAHKAFIERVWWEGGAPKFLDFIMVSKRVKEASDEAGTGSIRGACSVIEEVTDATLGEYITYRLKHKSFMGLLLKHPYSSRRP